MRVIAKGWASQQARACGFFFNHILCFTKTHAHFSIYVVWLETIGAHHSPLRILRPAGRDLEHHASRYACGCPVTPPQPRPVRARMVIYLHTYTLFLKKHFPNKHLRVWNPLDSLNFEGVT